MLEAQNIFFDLDGTLTDPKEGITKSVCYALAQMGYSPLPSPEELTHLVGPPLRDYFSLTLGEDKVTAATAHYVQRYNGGNACLSENSLYPDIPLVLSQLQRQNIMMYVVSSKPQVIVEKTVRHFEIDRNFKAIYGAELDETRSDKTELIAYIMEREKLEPASVVMVGDRKYDIIGAAQNHIRSIGVGWGYGSREELEAAGTAIIAHHPRDLLNLLVKPENIER